LLLGLVGSVIGGTIANLLGTGDIFELNVLGFIIAVIASVLLIGTANGSAIGRQADGSHQAYGYKYVLPQAFAYNQSTTGGQAPIRFSFASLDRTSTPDSVVVGEYANPGAGSRLFRFPIDHTDRMLAESADGHARATEAY
ncbi:hypothetical protein K7G98_35755, partial [Saccharothrix sp. MB29]|nr:hypothetical protein [Saccharothrix sp. MB29]